MDPIYSILKSLVDNFETILVPLNPIAISYQMLSFRVVARGRGYHWEASALRSLLEHCECTLGAQDRGTSLVLFALIRFLSAAHKNEEATNLLEECTVDESTTSTIRWRLLESLAISRFNYGNNFRAKICLQEAIEMYTNQYDPQNAQVVRLLFMLEKTLKKCREIDSAARVREKWMRIQESLVEIL